MSITIEVAEITEKVIQEMAVVVTQEKILATTAQIITLSHTLNAITTLVLHLVIAT